MLRYLHITLLFKSFTNYLYYLLSSFVALVSLQKVIFLPFTWKLFAVVIHFKSCGYILEIQFHIFLNLPYLYAINDKWKWSAFHFWSNCVFSVWDPLTLLAMGMFLAALGRGGAIHPFMLLFIFLFLIF